jgi:hypothetical protein
LPTSSLYALKKTKNRSEKTKKDLELLNLINAVYIGCRTVNENDRCDRGEG